MMADLKISDMRKMQQDLWEKHKEQWMPLEPQYARDSVLWAIGELGEVISIIKEYGEDKILSEMPLRDEFVTEIVDVYMYLNDVLLRYDVSPEEFSTAYLSKHKKNMERNFKHEGTKFCNLT